MSGFSSSAGIALSRVEHLIATWLLALGTNLSALWILVANGWMQYPVGARFNVDTMRMEVTDFMEVFFNPVAQAKFVHTVSAGYVTGSVFVLAVSAWYLLARTPYRVCQALDDGCRELRACVGAVASSCWATSSGYTAGVNQKMKISAIEAMWDTQPAPASFTLFGFPILRPTPRTTRSKFPGCWD